MKKTIIMAFCAALCLSLCGCDNSGSSNSDTSKPVSSTPADNSSSSDSSSSDPSETKTVSEKAQQVLSDVEFPSMVEVTADKLNVYFGIDEADVEEFSAYICGSGAAPDEFGIFVAKDADAAKRIKDALDARVDSQYTTFESYTPDAMYRFDDDFVEQNGNTVIYAICDNNEKAKEILK